MTLADELAQRSLEDQVIAWFDADGASVAARRLGELGIHTSRKSLYRWREAQRALRAAATHVAARMAANEARQAAHALDELANVAWSIERLNEVADFDLELMRGRMRCADGEVWHLPADTESAKVRLKAAKQLEQHIALRARLAEGVLAPGSTIGDPLRAIGDAMREIHSPHADSRLERELARLRADETIDVTPDTDDFTRPE